MVVNKGRSLCTDLLMNQLHQSANEPNWPQRIPFVFQGNTVETKAQPDTIYITKSGMYNISFMFCDPQLKDTVISGITV